ncbi:uncharacterized protein BT62DRAFT_1076204 [Guyanagaster necrorhizus]|uniref:Uncharacterized protein n=1 Tax=Guyanagaster necrorhizus TaxID=856835 RepID=A0A9P7VTY1_9AGAR|nr:uncharacterized protein BT62DRAFT_1076204 [Guyanagaster necrorhizus MCA 3950]KAG7446665.1 hypothetical protein BT62DRAFT_1076204 [Guyanagaster necrorhizus MCA 3950]
MSVTKIVRAVHSFVSEGQSTTKKLPKDAGISDIPTFVPIVFAQYPTNGEDFNQEITRAERRATTGPAGARQPSQVLFTTSGIGTGIQGLFRASERPEHNQASSHPILNVFITQVSPSPTPGSHHPSPDSVSCVLTVLKESVSVTLPVRLCRLRTDLIPFLWVRLTINPPMGIIKTGWCLCLVNDPSSRRLHRSARYYRSIRASPDMRREDLEARLELPFAWFLFLSHPHKQIFTPLPHEPTAPVACRSTTGTLSLAYPLPSPNP